MLSTAADRRRLGGRARSDLLGRAVLLIEHEFSQARDIQQALEHSGAHVLGPARNAESALALIAETKPNCAILGALPSDGSLVASALTERGIPLISIAAPIDMRALLKLTAQLSATRGPAP